MRTVETHRRRWGYAVVVGGLVAIAAAVITAGSGFAAATARPGNSAAPRIFGAARVGQVLTGDRGTWTNNPTSYAYSWLRCGNGGNNCDPIGGANGTQYTLAAADDGHTVRFRVVATNSDGSTTATSAHTDLVVASGRPTNTASPTIAGVAQERQALTGSNGTWTNAPSKFDVAWLRCDKSGASCSPIGGANKSTYTVTTADIGNTIRYRVTASNSAGSNVATSAQTAVVTVFRGNGCPTGGNPDQVANIEPPARLIVDTFQSDPAVATRNTQTLVVRFHVTSSCGGPVQGALVYATATPFNQFSVPPEQPTGADGWATLTFQRLAGFPVSSKQQLISMFVRARKSGENVLVGISNRRLVSLRANVKG